MLRFVESAALTSRACKTLQLANQEAHRLNHPTIGTAHLLLGLAKESLSPAAAMLSQLGFGLEWLRRQLARLHTTGPTLTPVPGALPYSQELRTFVEATVSAGEYTGVLPLTPELLLAALVDEPSELVGHILQKRRLALWRLRRRLRYLSM